MTKSWIVGLPFIPMVLWIIYQAIKDFRQYRKNKYLISRLEISTMTSRHGEFTLVYNNQGILQPAALSNEQHEMLQALTKAIPGEITVIGRFKCETIEAQYGCPHSNRVAKGVDFSRCSNCGAILKTENGKF